MAELMNSVILSLVRDQEGSCIWTVPPFNNGEPNTRMPKVPCSSAMFSEDGSRLMVVKPDGIISIFECNTYKEIRFIQVPSLAAANLSPCGTYLQTFQKQSAPQEKNVNIWSVETGASVYSFSQKNISKTTWYVYSIYVGKQMFGLCILSSRGRTKIMAALFFVQFLLKWDPYILY